MTLKELLAKQQAIVDAAKAAHRDLTEEEQREAHEQALRKATEEAYAKITHKSKSQPASNAANAANQQSLF